MYSWIEVGENSGHESRSVTRFVEKPGKETAEEFLRRGNHLWNSGIFMFRARSFLTEMQSRHPRIVENCRAAASRLERIHEFDCVPDGAYANSLTISVDDAVLENTDKAVVYSLASGWADLGSWSSLRAVGEKDGDDNVVCGDVMSVDTTDCHVFGNGRLVATVGVNGLTIADTPDALLVARKHCGEEVKVLVQQLKASERREVNEHLEVYRPWGRFRVLAEGEHHKVKHLSIDPGARLSLQKHGHRSEHWVVVTGTASVTKENRGKLERFLLSENESTYIPCGTVHALENAESCQLEIVEVQCGRYLGEDDIVRLDDVYGRVEASTSVATA